MKISKTHKKFADRLNNQTALEYPERSLGPNWEAVLNFWLYLDTLSVEERRIINWRYLDLDEDSRISAKTSAYEAAKDTIGNECKWAAWEVTPTFASAYATLELIGSHKLESLTFLPLFLAP